MKPFIGISGNLVVDQSKLFSGYKRSTVGNGYVESISLAGGVPVVLPVVEEKDDIKQQVDRIDGLILSGGQDVNPRLYGEEPSEKLIGISPERDEYEQHLIHYAIQSNKPILAVCRGMQILNVMFGGTLYQDISLIEGSFHEHVQHESSNTPSHSVTILEKTRLFQLYGPKLMTNSYHHQSVKQAAPGFQIAAISEDGVIEAIEKEGNLFVVGVQWHPELMATEHPYMLNLFKLFIQQI